MAEKNSPLRAMVDWMLGTSLGGAPEPTAALNPAQVYTDQEIAEFFRTGNSNSVGINVNESTSMRCAAYFRCLQIVSGAMANMSADLMVRESEGVRRPAVGHSLRRVLTVKPNQWQTPAEFKKLMQLRVLQRGNAIARKVMIGREVVSLIPLEPLRVQVEQLDTGKLRYRYTPANGMAELLPQEQVFHLRGLSLDGVTGIPLLRAMADALGIAIAADAATGRVMKNGNLSAGAVQVPGQMTDNAYQRLRDSLETVYAGAGNAGKWMILEEGSTAQRFSLSPEELQFLQLRDFQRYDIAAFMGVPPYLIGATEKSTSWGSGIEQQGIAFGTYTLLDHTKMWEEAIVRDLLSPAEAETYYFKFFLQSLVRADMKTRTAAYASGLQWGWLSPDAVRAMEDMNPREDGAGGRYYDPPNTASQPAPTGDPAADGNANEGNINDEPA